MSIASEITRLQQAKADIKTAIENKGVTVPSDATLDDYADLVDSISGGGGGNWESIARGMLDGTTSFSIPEEVGSIANTNWLYYRTKVIGIVLPSTTTTIADSYAFGCSSLLSIEVKGEITRIGNNAFRACSSLKELILHAVSPPTLANTNAFTSVPANFTIYVPDGSVSAYQGATNWASFASKIKGISERPTT